MNCSIARELLAGYVEDELTGSVSQSLSEHLQKCKSCAAEERLLRSLSGVLHSLPQKSASMSFTDEVMKSLLEAETVPQEEPVVKVGILSSVISATGLRPAWFGVRMAARSAKAIRYVPRPIVKLRTGDARSHSLTKLPVALGVRW